MSVDQHRHCQVTVLAATGTESGNGSTWETIENLELPNLPSNWCTQYFLSNKTLTDDLAGILQLINAQFDGVVYDSENQSVSGTKTFSDVLFAKTPDDTASGNEVVTAEWVRNVMQARDDSTLIQYVSASGNDSNDGKSQDKPKKSIDAAMAVLNSYRLSSPTGVSIQCRFNEGVYDINTSNTTTNSPMIAHPDAVNQNWLMLSGNPVSEGGTNLTSKLRSSFPIENNNWYSLLRVRVNNLSIYNLRIEGFTKANNVTGTTTCIMDSPTNQVLFYNVELVGNASVLFNAAVNTPRVDLQRYFAISGMNQSMKSNNVVFWDSETSFGLYPDGTNYQDIPSEARPKLVLKNISFWEWPNIWFAHSAPYTGVRCCDIVLDNVQCAFSNNVPGCQCGNGCYHANIYCINGTNINTVFPNGVSGVYNHVHGIRPSWYNPNWDSVS